jgi:hypothetical protein
MRLHVHLLDTVMVALVDSGSTHSFISLETASRLHLQPDYRPGIQVMVANGDRVPSTGICRGIHIFINNEEFVLDFFHHTICRVRDGVRSALDAHVGADLMGFWSCTDELLA